MAATKRERGEKYTSYCFDFWCGYSITNLPAPGKKAGHVAKQIYFYFVLIKRGKH